MCILFFFFINFVYNLFLLLFGIMMEYCLRPFSCYSPVCNISRGMNGCFSPESKIPRDQSCTLQNYCWNLPSHRLEECEANKGLMWMQYVVKDRFDINPYHHFKLNHAGTTDTHISPCGRIPTTIQVYTDSTSQATCMCVFVWGEFPQPSRYIQRVYPKKHVCVYVNAYIHVCVYIWYLCFVVLCNGLLCIRLIHILQGYFTGTGAIIWLPQCLWSNTEEYGLKSMSIFYGKYGNSQLNSSTYSYTNMY